MITKKTEPVYYCGAVGLAPKKILRQLSLGRLAISVLLFLTLLVALCPSARAANITSDFVASATPGNFSICVRATYSGDDNGNNTLLVEWGLNGVDYSLGSQVLPHAASYTYTISSLTNGTAYQVRVTS